jgi:hypothetical protein
VAQHKVEPLFRNREIQRQEHAAGLHHADDRGHIFNTALQRDADDDIALDTRAFEQHGDIIAQTLQIAVADLLSGMLDGGSGVKPARNVINHCMDDFFIHRGHGCITSRWYQFHW